MKILTKASALGMAIASLALFTACSSENEPVNAEGNVVAIKLVSNAVESRTARPVNSSEALSAVTNIEIQLWKKETAVWTQLTGAALIKHLTETELGWTGGNLGSESRTMNVRLKNLQASATYGISVKGYGNTLATSFSEAAVSGSDVFNEVATPGAASSVEEIFADFAAFTTNANGLITTPPIVTITRQVAGLLAYVKNVPSQVGGTDVTHVRVYASAKASAYNLVGEEFTGLTQTNSKTTLLELEMPTGAANINANGCWISAAVNAGDCQTGENCFLGGTFFAPFQAVTGENTITLALCNNATVLREWCAQIEGNSNFNCTRNQFYSLGRKPVAGSTASDQPIDFDNLEESGFTVTLSNDWTTLYELTLEEL